MTRRICCYFAFVTLIWSANTQDKAKVPDNMFKSNMTRNDFSNLLQSLIKLNEQRVSVLQRLYKLEDYGVLSEVLRSGDNQPAENGNPNNLFLIVMSKNESDPTRRKFGYEVVDTVKSLDIGSNKAYPKLNYVLDPAGYVSQKISRKENSIESLFSFIPMDKHKPKKTHKVENGSKEKTNTKKSNEVKNLTSLLRTLKKTVKAMKDKKYSKLNTVRNKGSINLSEEFWDPDDNRNNHPPLGHHTSPRHTGIFVTKMVTIEDTKSNKVQNHKNILTDKDDREYDYGSSLSEEYAAKVLNRQYAKTDSHISIKKHNPKPKLNKFSSKINVQGSRHPKFGPNKYILNNQGKKHPIIKVDIKNTTKKNNMRMPANRPHIKKDKEDIKSIIIRKELKIMNPVNSYKTDLSIINQNNKFPLKEKENDGFPWMEYSSAIGKEFHNNGPNRQYTKMDNDVSIKNVHYSNNLKPNKNTQSPKINEHSSQHPSSKFNKKKSMLNNEINKLPKIKVIIRNTTNKNNTKTPVNTNKTDILSNNNQDNNFPLQEVNSKYTKMITDITSEKPNSLNNTKLKINTDSPKINIQSNQRPKINKTKSVLYNHQDIKSSSIEADIKNTTSNNNMSIPVNRPHIKSNIADTLSNNNQNDKFPLEEKYEVDNGYGSPIGNKHVRNGFPKRLYTRMDTDISSEKPLDTNNTKPKINTDSSKINVYQHPSSKLNKNMSTLNNKNGKYSKVKADIKSTTHKNNIGISVNKLQIKNNKTGTLFKHSKKKSFPLEEQVKNENEYGSTFSKEYADNDPNRRYTKMDSDFSVELQNTNNPKPEVNKDRPKINIHGNQHQNQGNKYSKNKRDIKSTTNKNDIKMITSVTSDKTETISYNNQSDNMPLEDKDEDENEYGLPIGKEYNGNGPNRQYTKMDSDVPVKKLHDTNNPKPKISLHSPKINAQNNQQLMISKNKSNISNNYGNKYSNIKSTTNKNDGLISPVNKIDTLSNSNQNDKFPLEDKDKENENMYGSPYSKEYDYSDPTKNILINKNLMSMLNMYSTKKASENPPHSSKNINNTNKLSSLTTAKAFGSKIPKTTQDLSYKNNDNYGYLRDIGNYNKFSSLTTAKASGSEMPKTTKDVPYKKDKNYGFPKDPGNDSNFPSLSTARVTGSEIPKTTKVLPFVNKHNYGYPKDNNANNYNQGIARDLPNGVKHGDENTEKDIYYGKENPSRTIETINIKTIAKDSSSQLKHVAHKSKRFRPKTAKHLDHGINSNVKSRNEHDYDGEENFNNDGEFVIGENNDREFSVIVTNVGKDKQEKIKPHKNLRINSKKTHHTKHKPFARRGLEKCLNKKAKKLCSKACISAYKNVCTRMKCTSRAKRALKKECKKSCEKTFAKSSGKYSDESSGSTSGSDDSYSD